jgi:hypothetical protein
VQRTKEDVCAAALVRKFQAQLTADATYRDVFNPPRDGDCLMRCAVNHDFDGSGESAEAADDGGRAGEKDRRECAWGKRQQRRQRQQKQHLEQRDHG